MPSDADTDADAAAAWHRSWRLAAGLGLLAVTLILASGLVLPLADAFAIVVAAGALALPLGLAAIVVGLRARPHVPEDWRWAGPVALGAVACGFAILMAWTLVSLQGLENLSNLRNLSRL